VLSEDHPSTLTSMNNLAGVLRSQDKYEEAEEVLRQARGLNGTALDKEHPNTLTSTNNLVLVLSDRSEYGQAEEMHLQ
jgi:hypothetical protein